MKKPKNKNRPIVEFMGGKIDDVHKYSDNPVYVFPTAPKIGGWCKRFTLSWLFNDDFVSDSGCYHISNDWLLPVWKKCIEVIKPVMEERHWESRKNKIVNLLTEKFDILNASIEIANLINYYNENCRTKSVG